MRSTSACLDGLPLLADYGTSFTEYVIRTPKKDVTDSQGHKVFRGRQTHRLPCRMYPTEDQFYNAVAKYIRGGYQMLDRIGNPTQRRAAGFLLDHFSEAQRQLHGCHPGRACRGGSNDLQGEIDGLPAQQDSDEDDPTTNVTRASTKRKRCFAMTGRFSRTR